MLAVALAIIVARVYFNMRRCSRPLGPRVGTRRSSRSCVPSGYAPFNAYPVDFFLALPDEAACRACAAASRPTGSAVDVKPLENDPELHFSLHAKKTMRLIVPDMQELGRQLTAIATEFRRAV